MLISLSMYQLTPSVLGSAVVVRRTTTERYVNKAMIVKKDIKYKKFTFYISNPNRTISEQRIDNKSLLEMF